MAKIALGTAREATQPDCIQALIVEFIATFLFVFAGVGSAMTAGIYITLIFIILLIQQ
jgi:aquaporin TIP